MKVKPTPTSPKARLESDSREIEHLYDSMQRIEQPARPPRMAFSTLLLTLVFGFLAGIIGELVFNAYLIGENSPLLRALRGESVASLSQQHVSHSNESIPSLKTIASVNDALLGIFEVRSFAGTVEGVYPQEAQLGTAAILSEDGWAVTTSDVLAREDASYAAITNDKRVLAIKHRVKDPATNLVYFQIDGGNFSIVSLAKPFDLLPMNEFIALTSNPQRSLQRERITNIQQLRFLSGNNLESSDVLSRRLLIDEITSVAFRGGVIVDESGAVVGIIGATENGNTAVTPAEYISQVLIELLRDDTMTRPSLGIRYLDLATVPGIPEAQRFLKNSGALLIGLGDVAAIQPGSSAEEAGLRAGDVITKVNTEDITELKGLSDILQAFHPDDVITLTIIRDGAEKSIEATVEKLI